MRLFLRSSIVFLICVLFGSVLYAQQNSGPNSSPAVNTVVTAGTPGVYQIGPGDVLDVKVFNHPEYTTTLQVGGDGNIRVPFFDGQLNVTCKTEQQIQDMVRETLLTILRRPLVSVTVKDYKSRPVKVVGSVRTPTQFYLQRRARLMDLINEAGGLAPTAGPYITVVHPSGPVVSCDEPEPFVASEPTERIDVKQLESGDPSVNRYVHIGETIEVPEGGKVFLTGAVTAPTSILLTGQFGRLTLLHAISMAGGTPYEAKRDQIEVYRMSDKGDQKPMVYNLNKIQSDLKSDPILQEGDVVFVPSSGVKKVFKGLSQSMLVNPAVARQLVY
ncbi:MAG TPA: polysaccharide biosynthesis/export family protein [Blastocatellia bacterium]|nr:polysaccharide biosynthesis/export family protein [Blastocatellia bacterium]